MFAGDEATEGADRPNLNLPGDENALIEAVAAVNRTRRRAQYRRRGIDAVAVHVAAVLEAWYPGQEDGQRFGRIGRRGRPVGTSSDYVSGEQRSRRRKRSAIMFPGVDGTVDFGSDLDIGYRWYQANHVTPLFAFGYGLDYTNFTLSDPTFMTTPNGVDVRVAATNVGLRSGDDVVQVYVRDPLNADEPPEQLRAFARVQLSPGQSSVVRLAIPWSQLQVFEHGAFTLVAGNLRHRHRTVVGGHPVPVERTHHGVAAHRRRHRVRRSLVTPSGSESTAQRRTGRRGRARS